MKRLFPIFLITLALFIEASVGYAAELVIEASPAAAETEFLLPVVLTDLEDINVVEGTLTLPEGITLVSIDTSGSAFPLFAEKPRYEPATHSVEFVAGAPTSVPDDSDALLFVIHARAASSGTYTITPTRFVAYINDGKGTSVNVSSQPTLLSVVEKGSLPAASRPEPATEPLIAEVGRDDTLFSGQWFVAFFGGSSGASVAHYEVREGWWKGPTRADRYYVLKNQSRSTTVWVSAISENGKKVTVHIPPANPWPEYALLFGLAVLVVVILFLTGKWIRRKQRSKFV